MCARKWERVCVYVCMCMRKWERVCVGKKNSVLVCVWVRECVCVWVRKIEFIYTICCTKALKIINLAFLWFLVTKIDTSTPAIKCLKYYIAFYNLK